MSSRLPEASSSALDELWETIVQRRADRPDKSYVVHLLDGGSAMAGAKVIEEAAELVEAAGENDSAHLVHEAADLFFHALVLLATTDQRPAQVYGELARRFGTSGLTEKAGRTPSANTSNGTDPNHTDPNDTDLNDTDPNHTDPNDTDLNDTETD